MLGGLIMLVYKNKFINFNGITYKVLDTNKLSFKKAVLGIKNKIIMVKCAEGGERIETKNSNGNIESVIVAQKGDAIFFNSQADVYIPHDNNGCSWKFAEIKEYGYDIIEEKEDCIFIRSNNKALLLVEVIEIPTCIENAFGKNIHQFLYPGATLKKDHKTKQITGIDKESFDSTWKVLPNQKNNKFRLFRK